MVAETPSDTGRVPIAVPRQLHTRLARIMAEIRDQTGRSVTFAEVIERALDRAEMREEYAPEYPPKPEEDQ